MKTELRKIPGIGSRMEEELGALGFTTIESLKGQDPEELYARQCLLRGRAADRCQLYVLRCAVYFASTNEPDPEKLKWWHWKDEPTDSQVCVVPSVQKSQLLEICRIADEVWHEHYTGLLGKEQVDYMVRKFQSFEAIVRQMKEEGYQYFLLERGGANIGYTAVRVEEESLFLSKLYVLQSARHCGAAATALQFMEELCRSNSLARIWLTVNKYNEDSIAVYRRMGFQVAYEQTVDIGEGFFMDDYVMEKNLPVWA